MTKLITAPANTDVPGVKLYLAGAIDMGEAVNWQQDVIEALADQPDLVILNPRREKFTPEMEDEQIRWELDAMTRADRIILWFPAGSKAPVSFFEAGLFMHSGKLLIGVEDGFYRQRNLELTCEFYDVALWHSLEELIAAGLREYQRLREQPPN